VRPSKCTGETERRVTRPDVNKYIGTPFHMKELRNSLLEYLERPLPIFPYLPPPPDPQPINVLLYAILVNLIASTKGCVITSVNNSSPEFLYYRHFPSILQSGTQWLHQISDDERIQAVEAIVTEHVVLTGLRYMQFATCDGVKTQISFGIYIKTYDFSSWLWIRFHAIRAKIIRAK